MKLSLINTSIDEFSEKSLRKREIFSDNPKDFRQKEVYPKRLRIWRKENYDLACFQSSSKYFL